MDETLRRWVDRLPTTTKLAIVGGFCLILGVLGLLIFLPQSDLGSAAGSGALLLVGLGLSWAAYRRRGG